MRIREFTDGREIVESDMKVFLIEVGHGLFEHGSTDFNFF